MIGVAVSTICMYETGERSPRDEIKVKIANALGKSVNYIFLENDVTKCDTTSQKGTHMSLKEFRDNLGLTQNQMADEIGVSKSYYSKVESGFQNQVSNF